MKKTGITFYIVILLVLLVGFFFFYTKNENSAVGIEPLPPDSFTPEKIVADFVFDKGVHTYTGVISLPNPCYTLETEAVVRESYPEQVTISFIVKKDEEQACIQVIDERLFTIIFQASSEAVVNAEYNGKRIDLILLSQETVENE